MSSSVASFLTQVNVQIGNGPQFVPDLVRLQNFPHKDLPPILFRVYSSESHVGFNVPPRFLSYGQHNHAINNQNSFRPQLNQSTTFVKDVKGHLNFWTTRKFKSPFISLSCSLVGSFAWAKWLEQNHVQQLSIAIVNTKKITRCGGIIPASLAQDLVNKTSHNHGSLKGNFSYEYLVYNHIEADMVHVTWERLKYLGVEKLLPELNMINPRSGPRWPEQIYILQDRLSQRSQEIAVRTEEIAIVENLATELFQFKSPLTMMLLSMRPRPQPDIKIVTCMANFSDANLILGFFQLKKSVLRHASPPITVYQYTLHDQDLRSAWQTEMQFCRSNLDALRLHLMTSQETAIKTATGLGAADLTFKEITNIVTHLRIYFEQTFQNPQKEVLQILIRIGIALKEVEFVLKRCGKMSLMELLSGDVIEEADQLEKNVSDLLKDISKPDQSNQAPAPGPPMGPKIVELPTMVDSSTNTEASPQLSFSEISILSEGPVKLVTVDSSTNIGSWLRNPDSPETKDVGINTEPWLQYSYPSMKIDASTSAETLSPYSESENSILSVSPSLVNSTATTINSTQSVGCNPLKRKYMWEEEEEAGSEAEKRLCTEL